MAAGEARTFRTGVNPVALIIDGRPVEGGWRVSPELNPDVLETTASEIVFVSDKDTLEIADLKEWDSLDFVMVTDSGDSAFVRVDRKAVNPFENPDPKLLETSASGMLSREQALFDIDALIFAISQVHPDIFSVCR